MRKLSTILLSLLFIINSLHAQTHIGIKHGLSLWLTKSGYGRGSLSFSERQTATYDKGITTRITLSPKFVLEESLLYYAYSETDISYAEDVVELKNSLQYDVTYPLLGYMFPILKHTKTYVGLSIAPRIHMARNNNEASGGRDAFYSCLFGFSYTHVIPLTKNIFVQSQYIFEMKPFDNHKVYTGNIPLDNRRISWNTSLIFKL
ncbi:MAG: hypothetical protein ACK4EY_03470 [Flavipsychrobacter sp.]|nr:hypothetical protein [Chitinophagales bacterium]